METSYYIPHYRYTLSKNSFPSTIGKLLKKSEMLVGAVGIEFTTLRY
jgi:predicted RNA-binding protein (virulence factor B family)